MFQRDEQGNVRIPNVHESDPLWKDMCERLDEYDNQSIPEVEEKYTNGTWLILGCIVIFIALCYGVIRLVDYLSTHSN